MRGGSLVVYDVEQGCPGVQNAEVDQVFEIITRCI
jgi:hypothetical protein